MYVTGHDTPCEYIHPLFFLAVMEAINNYVVASVTDKHVQPLYNSKTDEVHAFRITKFRVSAHFWL